MYAVVRRLAVTCGVRARPLLVAALIVLCAGVLCVPTPGTVSTGADGGVLRTRDGVPQARAPYSVPRTLRSEGPANGSIEQRSRRVDIKVRTAPHPRGRTPGDVALFLEPRPGVSVEAGQLRPLAVTRGGTLGARAPPLDPVI
ncbi:MAG: hypothetical protein AB7E80_08415 [Hyphomicrobiaceae bacterium]